MTVPFRVKVCGVTDRDNAIACVEAGADALGFNFCQRSKRYCSPDLARQVIASLPSQVVVVGLFVDTSVEEIASVRERCGFEWVQLHGCETPEQVQALGPSTYKAVNGGTDIVWPGAGLMVDAPKGVGDEIPGGHGRRWHWEKAREVPRQAGQSLLLAGGLDQSNVAAAIAAARPDAVDVASGVESRPGHKDPQRVRDFVIEAQRAFATLTL